MDKWIIWCHRDAEQDALEKAFKGDCVSIRGSTSHDDREQMELAWREGNVPIMITKPSVFGWGMNWQHCAKMVSVGLSDSFEQLIQSEWRIDRFGQTKPVHHYVITHELEGAVVRNIERKEKQYNAMMDQLVQHISIHTDLGHTSRITNDYNPQQVMRLPVWLKEAT
jgi:ATP-dependent helicase YprA (DUF1998 family)